MPAVRRKRRLSPGVTVMRRPHKRRRTLSLDDRMLTWALDQVARSGSPLALSDVRGGPSRRSIAARYDAATTSPDNARHWSMADGLSADAAASHAVRQVLRNRARYEVANNSYARGIINTLADDTIGTGPRLRLDTGDETVNQLVERTWRAWTREVGLADHLRLMRKAKATEGEAFAALITNEALRHAVKMDLMPLEADQVTSPEGQAAADNIDGVLLDQWGRPKAYQVLRTHPGSQTGALHEYSLVAAESMIHWFRPDRPGQHRGLPELMPSLGLFAQLRRYTLAVADAAEAAADFAIVLYTDHPADDECDYIKSLDQVDLERGLMTTMPEGWKPEQIKGEQPTTTFEMFVRALLREIARCIGMPYCIAAGDSSGYNFASGRLDHKTYYKGIRIEQEHIERVVLDRILVAWLREAALAGVVPASLAAAALPEHQWFWDGDEHVDPVKESVAITELMAHGATGLPEVFAGFGQDWRVEMQRNAEALGITLPEYQALLRQKLFGSASAESSERARRLADRDEPPAEEPAEEPPASRRTSRARSKKEAVHA